MSIKRYSIKIVMAGEGSVGKTSLVNQYIDNRFGAKTTIGMDIMTKVLYYDDIEARLNIWDLAGQEHFNVVRERLYAGANALVYVFDLTRPRTLERLVNWFKEHERNNKEHDTTVAILVGNKSDLESKIPGNIDDKALELYDNNQGANIIDYIRTSAKDDINVEITFKKLAKEAVKRV